MRCIKRHAFNIYLLLQRIYIDVMNGKRRYGKNVFATFAVTNRGALKQQVINFEFAMLQ